MFSQVNPFDVNVTKNTNDGEWTLRGGMFSEIFQILTSEVNVM